MANTYWSKTVTVSTSTLGTAASNKAAGDTITADTYRTMINTLDAMIEHSHTYTDSFITNCQCNCGRGNL